MVLHSVPKRHSTRSSSKRLGDVKERRHPSSVNHVAGSVTPGAVAPERSFVMPDNDADLNALRMRLNASLKVTADGHTSPRQEAVVVESRQAEEQRASGLKRSPFEWRASSHHRSREELWQAIRAEAQADANAEPALASFLYTTILGNQNLERSMSLLLANKLASSTMLGTQLLRLIQDAYEDEPEIMEACCADMQAVMDRDPACDKFTQCMLYFKGFQAVQSYRIANWLWKKGRRALAFALQSRISEVFHVDIHPAAAIGRGVLMDHATGVVIGETAIIGDNVSMLHHVTLGGSGTGRGLRHPHIGHGVLLGAGVSVLGPVTVGDGSKVGAGSVVVTDLPCHCVAVGVPARIVKQNVCTEPCKDMDQTQDFILDYVI